MLLRPVAVDALEIPAAIAQARLDGTLNGKVLGVSKGKVVLVDPPPPSLDEEKAIYAAAVQTVLDDAAKLDGYDNIATAISYAEEPAVPKFQNDGKRYREWRSLVWAYVYEQLDLVMDGTREKPTVVELLAELPPLPL